MKKVNKYKTVKISEADFVTLNKLKFEIFKRKKLILSNKILIGWALKNAIFLLENNENFN